jgi:hypothetical protein
MSKSKGKPINVSLRIIADLSQGIYRSPADALKELISNAYDADSPTVEINFSSDFNSLTIRDFGKGMTTDDFIKVMETIGGSPKRSADSEEEFTPTGRPIIGRIGIGLLSVSQISSKLEVHSSTEGSTTAFTANIEFDQFASEEARKIKITDLWEKDKEIKIGQYYIKEFESVDKNNHFTTLKLHYLKKVLVDKLTVEQELDGYPRKMGKDFFHIKELLDWMRWHGITKNALHEYDRIIFELGILSPVSYLDNALTIYHFLDSTSSNDELARFIQEVNNETHLKLLIDGIEYYRPILMPHEYDHDYYLFFNLLFMKGLHGRIIKYNDYNENNNPIQKELKLKGYIYFQKRRIWPPEMAGLLIRVRNVAVGQYDSTFLNYRRHEAHKFSQITGEIYVDNLDSSLNIDRSSFRETEPAFIAFRNAIHNYLNKTVFPGIKKYANMKRKEIGELGIEKEKELLSENFGLIDSKGRDIVIGGDQGKLIERDSDSVSIATSLKGRKLKFSKEFHRIISFMEAKLSNEIEEDDRDELYKQLVEWLIDYDVK